MKVTGTRFVIQSRVFLFIKLKNKSNFSYTIMANIVKIIIFSIIITFSIFLYCFSNSIKVKPIKITKLHKINKDYINPLRNNKVIITSFHIGVGRNDSVGIQLATPYNNRAQRSQLYKNEVRIKNDFLINVGEDKLKKWMEKRNYKAIKSKFLQIVNNYIDNPIEEVYICKIFYE